MVVDEIKGRMDVVMKNLGPHLRHVHGVAGVTVLGNGRVVLILELIELLSSRSGAMSGASGTIAPPALREVSPVQTYQQGTRAEVGVPTQSRTTTVPTIPTIKPTATPASGKYILVVDDSPSVRRVVGNMLNQNRLEAQVTRHGGAPLDI